MFSNFGPSQSKFLATPVPRNALFLLKIVKSAEHWGLCLQIPNVSPLQIPDYALHYNYSICSVSLRYFIAGP